MVPALPRRHPVSVPPAVARELHRPGRRPRPQLGGEGAGVGLVQQLPRRRLDKVFIQRPLGHAGHKARPDAAADMAQPALPRLPAGELAHHPDAPHPRRPHGEAHAVRAVLPGKMGPQPAVAAAAFAPGEPGQLFLCHPAIFPHALPPAACRPSFVSRRALQPAPVGRLRPRILRDAGPAALSQYTTTARRMIGALLIFYLTLSPVFPGGRARFFPRACRFPRKSRPPHFAGVFRKNSPRSA